MYKTSYKKYGNKRTEYNGRKFDSKFEAGIARDLEMMKRAGEILDYDCQFKIECIPYDKHGNPLPALKVTHKVDFRRHNLDGTYTLIEAKGMEMSDWQRRRKWLEYIWLPEHLDHDYEVVYQKGWRKFK